MSALCFQYKKLRRSLNISFLYFERFSTRRSLSNINVYTTVVYYYYYIIYETLVYIACIFGFRICWVDGNKYTNTTIPPLQYEYTTRSLQQEFFLTASLLYMFSYIYEVILIHQI